MDDFVGYAQQRPSPPESHLCRRSGREDDYNNFLFNADPWPPDPDSCGLISPQGFEIPDPAKYYGSGTYQLVDGHYRLLNSVNVNDSTLDGIKVNNLRAGLALHRR